MCTYDNHFLLLLPSYLSRSGALQGKVWARTQDFDELLATPWDQEAQIVPAANALVMLNDLLVDSAVLVQGYRLRTDATATFVDVAMPMLPPGGSGAADTLGTSREMHSTVLGASSAR